MPSRPYDSPIISTASRHLCISASGLHTLVTRAVCPAKIQAFTMTSNALRQISGSWLHPADLIDDAWLAGTPDEEVIDPMRPIIDPHHHLWQRPPYNYMVPEFVADLHSGHNISATVFVDCGLMYRRGGDPRLASLGEVEVSNGVAAMFASGAYGPTFACAGIVTKVDLSMGAFAQEVLEMCIARAPERFRGVRHMAAWDASPEVSALRMPPPPDLLLDSKFREGFAVLGRLGLSFDAWVYHPQLGQLIDLVDAFPDTRVILNHVGGRAGVGPYAARQPEVWDAWKRSLTELARRPNVWIKVGGLGMPLAGHDFFKYERPPTSVELAQAWGPCVDTCVEIFGASRSMFESNFPVDKASCTYKVLWNGFKRIAGGWSAAEKNAVFAGTAAQAYRLPAELTRDEAVQPREDDQAAAVETT